MRISQIAQLPVVGKIIFTDSLVCPIKVMAENKEINNVITLNVDFI